MTVGIRAESTMPGEVLTLLVEFSTALHRHAMYPPGHPALAQVAEGLVARAGRLLEDREQIAIGVARRQLVVEGVPTDPAHPVIARLADTLHAHQLGAISLVKGLEASEMADALRVLSTDAEFDHPLGLRPPASLPAWRHIRLHPLVFDHLALDTSSDAAGAVTSQWRGAELWLGLAQAAMAGRAAGEAERVDTTPTEVARAIDEHDGASAYDQLVVGYLLQIARTLRTATPSDAEALRSRTSGLIGALSPATLRRLVRVSRAEGTRAGFVRDAVHGLDPRAVLDVLNATADVTGETISDGLARMLAKLAAQGAGDPVRSDVASEALRAQVTRLLIDWRLEDPNPELYSRLLTDLSAESQRSTEGTRHDAGGGDPRASGHDPGGSHDRGDAADAPAGPRDARDAARAPILDGDVRLVEMALEIGEMGGVAAQAVDRAVHAGHAPHLLDLLQRAPDDAGEAAAALRARLVGRETLDIWLADDRIDLDRLDVLQPWMTLDSYEALLDALARSGHRATRRRLLDRLARAPFDLSASIRRRLDDDRWYVQRNMLYLLAQQGGAVTGVSMAAWLGHADWRVRYEAVRVCLTMSAERDAVLRRALGDSERRVVALALRGLGGGSACPRDLVPRVAALAADRTVPDAVRVLAVHALEKVSDARAVAALVGLVDGGRTIFGRVRLAPPDDLCLAALGVLARGHAGDADATPYLDLARASTHNAVRAAVSGPTA
ncbi:MAG: hypothetical protein R2712_12580 [Vicinamibacterales bacterium]